MHLYRTTQTTPLNATEIEAILDECLECDLNRLDAGPLSITLSKYTRSQQERALYWVKIGTKAHTEIGYSIALNSAAALRLMTDDMMETWVIHAMGILDTQGLVPAVQSINAAEKFAAEAVDRARGVTFEEVSGMLALFVQGLSGRRLKLERDELAWTDTETIYLPAYVGRFESHEDNFRLYKSILAHQWAQIWFGTWRVASLDERGIPELMMFQGIPASTLKDHSHETCQKYLHALESIRLDACIARELPGIYRDMHYVLDLLDETLVPKGWESAAQKLQNPKATIQDSCALLQQVIRQKLPANHCFQGIWNTDNLIIAMQSRLEKEKKGFQKAVWKLSEEMAAKAEENKNKEADKDDEDEVTEIMGLKDAEAKNLKLELKESENVSLPDDFRFDITLDDEPMKISWDTRESMNSILQDFGDIPEEYLEIGGAGAYDAEEVSERKPEDLWGGTYHEDGALYYDEWDYLRNHYRKDWCVLRELPVKPGNLAFVHKTLRKYHKEVKQIHKSFEALRGEDKLLKRQINGDDVDVDAVVEAWADAKMGMEMTDRLYTQMNRVDRSIAVMFMVDMSGSTKGWINEAERESLILLCEALEKLGDRYAIYGFSGWARKRCDIFKIKSFEDQYHDEEVQGRIAGIEAQEYTRMGVAIRHLSQLLNTIDAKTRILVTLSDGRPEDYGEYRGKYGIEDTRMALVEARRSGIHPFCITIDKEGLEYLPHMYGPASYVVLDDVAKLPLKVADIYRKLTS